MNHLKKIVLMLLILLGAFNASAAETDTERLEADLRVKTSELQQMTVKYQKLTRQVTALAPKISELKSKGELNFFQRRKLEDYLKSSQKIAGQIEKVNRQILRLRQELQVIREHLIQNYDRKITQLLAESEKNALSKTQKRKLLQQLSQLKQQRNALQANIDWEISEPGKMSHIEIEEYDTPRKIQAKADWLKDLENRLRLNVTKIDRVVQNLREEIELRDKMQDFEQELSLFSHRDEARMPSIPSVEKQTEVFGEDQGGPPELTTKGTETTGDAAMLPLFPDFLHENDFMNLSTADIRSVIDSLSHHKIEILTRADSLNQKATIFYQKAEQARPPRHQEKK